MEEPKMSVEFPSYSTPACVRRVDTVIVAMDITTAIKVADILAQVEDNTATAESLSVLVNEMRRTDDVGTMVPSREYVLSYGGGKFSVRNGS